jgi:hypothetical protein
MVFSRSDDSFSSGGSPEEKVCVSLRTSAVNKNPNSEVDLYFIKGVLII